MLRNLALFLLAGITGAVGCAMNADDLADRPASTEGAAFADASTLLHDDASNSVRPNTNIGSPLCNINQTATRWCKPDDTSPAECAYFDAGVIDTKDAAAGHPDGGADASDALTAYDAGIQDAGVQDADDASASTACRVVQRDSTVVPICTAAGTGGEGDECRASSDCGAGFECVGTPGQCRSYCCFGQDSCQTDRICDKQIVFSEQYWVPVCIPIRPCKLLTTKACPDNETCGIIDQTDGRTSCLPIGSAGAGESCETANCAAGLTCLGSNNERTCFKLCSKGNAADCPANHKCKGTSPLFQNADQGVCLPEVQSGSAQR